MIRVGQGWDLHKLVPGRKLVLGGIMIPSPAGEDAHSDGDVLIHAIIDALYGAVAEGDIGSHYPDTDSAYAGVSSILLLRDTLEKVAPWKPINIDATVILQAPKLRPHVDEIRSSLAKAMDLPLDAVSVKAKTTEGLLADAVIAQAAVLLSRP